MSSELLGQAIQWDDECHIKHLTLQQYLSVSDDRKVCYHFYTICIALSEYYSVFIVVFDGVST